MQKPRQTLLSVYRNTKSQDDFGACVLCCACMLLFFLACVSLVPSPVVVANQPRNNVCFDTGRHEIKLGTNLA